MKSYHQVPILECGEPLVPLPFNVFAIEQPHPYQKLGAPYGKKSPYYLRQDVIEHLIAAQTYLQQQCPGWRMQIFDAYRPIAVQEFMVNYTFNQVLQTQGINSETLTPSQHQAILKEVYQFWAVPSTNPMTPPPHSTGAAIDVTLINAQGEVVDMGSPIDELSPRSYPNYFEHSEELSVDGCLKAMFHRHRQLLRKAMLSVGFCQHPQEWWHFSLGDQMWAWFTNRNRIDTLIVARYGAIE
jgi:zinc D-Ala-D-Ala dipeptidase